MLSLLDFDAWMRRSRDVRREFANAKPDTAATAAALREILDVLAADGGAAEAMHLEAPDGRKYLFDVSYEILELRKDLDWLGGADLPDVLDLNASERADTLRLADFLGRRPIAHWITDRDGTINNYCGRYSSSVQSAYNAAVVDRFAGTLPGLALILTSAPLGGDGITEGLLDLSTLRYGAPLACAGSKGREYVAAGRRGRTDIAAAQQRALDDLAGRINAILQTDSYRKFALIGSGFQRKVGQLTVARQDSARNVDAKESEAFLAEVRRLTAAVDPANLRIEDTGLDIEVHLAVAEEAGAREFDKGDGLRFVLDELRADVRDAPVLVCGDTASDVPLVTAALECAGSANVTAVFVTEYEEVRERVRGTGAQAFFVTKPDALVGALYLSTPQ